MVTIYNTPLSTTSEKALFGRPGGGRDRKLEGLDMEDFGLYLTAKLLSNKTQKVLCG